MQTANHCAFNLTRNIAICESLVIVSSFQSPSQLLALVLNGPGRNANSGVWLSGLNHAAEMPRLFAFDVAYLDHQNNIIKTAAVGPATPFPPLSDEVASILYLADGSHATSRIVSGDRVKICSQAELQSLTDPARSGPVETSGVSGSTFAPPEPRDALGAQVHPRFTDLFSASLIYLPSSGPPPASEFFLSAEPSRVLQPGDTTLTESNSGPAQASIPEQPGKDPVLLQTVPNPEPSRGPSSPSQLPPGLQAVLDSVDEQIRREGREQEIEPVRATGIRAEENKVIHPVVPERSQQPATPRAHIEPSEQSREPAPQPASDPTQKVSQAKETSASEDRREAFRLAQTGSVELPSQTRLAPSKAARSLQNSVRAEAPQGVRSAWGNAESELPGPSHREREFEPIADAKTKGRLSFAARVQRWLSGESRSLSGNRRRGERFSVPGLVAFYWTGGAPTPHEIVNISTSGLYLRSKELWSPDTLVRMTLERQDAEWERPESISVLARVVRRDEGGVAHEFIMTEMLENLRVRDFLPEHGTSRKELQRFLAIH